MRRLVLSLPFLALWPQLGVAQVQRRIEVRFGATAMLAERAVDFEGRQRYASGVLPGGELTASLGPALLRARLLGGKLAAADDTTGMAAATIGDLDVRAALRLGPVLAVEAGINRRVLTGQLATQVWNATRLGARLELRAAETGLYFVASGAYYPSVSAAGGGGGGSGTGTDFESAVRINSPTSAIWLSLGYRFERRELPGLTAKMWERFSGIVVGGGLAFGPASAVTR